MPRERRSGGARKPTRSRISQESSGWTVEVLDVAKAQLANLPRGDRALLLRFLHESVENNPRRIGRALVDSLSGFWRYRIGDYRIICTLDERRRIAIVVRVGRRNEVYLDRPE